MIDQPNDPAPEAPAVAESSRYPAKLFSSIEELPEGLPPGVGPGPRIAARLLDIATHWIVAFVAGLFAVMIFAISVAAAGGDVQGRLARLQNPDQGPGVYVLSILGAFLMHVVGEGLHGSTVGKRLLGLVVIGENGGQASLAGAFKRSLAFYWDGLFFGAPGIISMNNSPREQRNGDKWGKTMVVRLRDLPPGERPSTLRFLGATALALSTDGVLMSVVAIQPLL